MCGRYVVVQKMEVIEKRFNVEVKTPAQFTLFVPNHNVSIGQMAPVITDDKPGDLQFFEFGMKGMGWKKLKRTGEWKQFETRWFNARSEGDKNKENDPKYKGRMGIFDKKSFKSQIRNKRCLVIADAFIEGTTTERLDKPFVVYLKNKVRPFAMAGIWDSWTDKETGEVINSFAIITTMNCKVPRKLLTSSPN